MWRSKGRSGVGDQVMEKGEGIGFYEDMDGLSLNGRQYRNSETNLQRDLSGANYWHLRKEMYPRFGHVKIDDYPTPSYYHLHRVCSKKMGNQGVEPDWLTVDEMKGFRVVSPTTKHTNRRTISEDNYFLRLYKLVKRV